MSEFCGMTTGSTIKSALTRSHDLRKAFISSGVTVRQRHDDSSTIGTDAKATTNAPCPQPRTRSGPHRATPDNKVTRQEKALLAEKLLPLLLFPRDGSYPERAAVNAVVDDERRVEDDAIHLLAQDGRKAVYP